MLIILLSILITLDVGTAKAVFTGIGNYTGTYKATNFFKITKKKRRYRR